MWQVVLRHTTKIAPLADASDFAVLGSMLVWLQAPVCRSVLKEAFVLTLPELVLVNAVSASMLIAPPKIVQNYALLEHLEIA